MFFFSNHTYILHAKLSAVELNFLGEGGSLYEYNIVKTNEIYVRIGDVICALQGD